MTLQHTYKEEKVSAIGCVASVPLSINSKWVLKNKTERALDEKMHNRAQHMQNLYSVQHNTDTGAAETDDCTA